MNISEYRANMLTAHDKLESLGIASSLDHMKYVINMTSWQYGCLRPPGAAGAGLLTTRGIILGTVQPPFGSANCKEQHECEMENGHCVRNIHAEQRAIINAALFGICTYGSHVYSILKPCYQCTKAIIAAGVTHIFYVRAAYDEERTKAILNAANVTIERLDINIGYGEIK